MNDFKIILALDTSSANHLILRLITSNQVYDFPPSIEHLESDLIPAIDSLLKQVNLTIQDVDAFIIGKGPGSFMGLRLGFSVFRTWAWIYDKAIITVSSLELLRRSTSAQEQDILYIPCVDSKMKRVFANITSTTAILLEDCDIFPQVLAQHIIDIQTKNNYKKIVLIGSGAPLIQEFLQNPIVENVLEIRADLVITIQSFDRSYITLLDKNNFSKESTDQLKDIKPNYCRLSAAEMSLLEKESQYK